jgi:iron complex transport system ATP-binding protein
VIRLEGVHAGYGPAEVLRGIDLTFASGEMVGLLGPNGSGKTTLVKVMSGALSPRAGRVELEGRPLAHFSPRQRARRLAVVPQRFEPSAELTAGELVLHGRYPYLSFFGAYASTDHEAAQKAMKATATVPFAHRPLTALSGGEVKRVLVARALAQATPALILDEAVSELDLARSVEICELLACLNSGGRLVIMALHDVNLAALFCRRLVFIKNGRVAVDGPTAEVFTATILSDIYDTDIIVTRHPVLDVPQAHLLPRAARARARTACRSSLG